MKPILAALALAVSLVAVNAHATVGELSNDEQQRGNLVKKTVQAVSVAWKVQGPADAQLTRVTIVKHEDTMSPVVRTSFANAEKIARLVVEYKDGDDPMQRTTKRVVVSKAAPAEYHLIANGTVNPDEQIVLDAERVESFTRTVRADGTMSPWVRVPDKTDDKK